MALLSPPSFRFRPPHPALPAAASGDAPQGRHSPWRRLFASVVQAGLLVAAGTGTLAVHRLVAAESVGDQASLALIAGVVVGLLIAAALATRFILRRPTSRMAGAALPLGLLLVCGLFVKASVIDASVEMESLVVADGTPEPAATITLGPGGHDIRFSGEITEGVAARLAAVLAANPDVSRIALTSDGGLADEGQALGDVIAAHRLDTFVPDFCVSACTLAFVRGRERLLQEDARLGFHAPYEEGLFGTMYKGDSSEQRDAYLAAGLAPDFVEAALKVDPAGVWFPHMDRLRAAGVVTAAVDRYSLPDSDLDGTASTEGARSLVLRNFPLMSVFLKQSSRGVDAIADWYLDAYRHGRSEGENTDNLRAVVRGAIAVALAKADDATLIDLARFLSQTMENVASPGDCVAIGSQADLLAAREADDAGADDPAAALLERALAGQHAPAGLTPAGDRGSTGKRALSCTDWQRTYRDIIQGSQATGAAAMRTIVDAQAARSLVGLGIIARRRG